MPNKSKTKGSNAERELSKFLSETFEASFIRVQGSGAFLGRSNYFRKATLDANQVSAHKGDIQAPSHMSKLVIESKAYAEFRFHQLLQPGPCAQLEEWIEQALDAIDEGDFWVIAFKINLMGWYVAVPETFKDALLFENSASYHGPQGSFVLTELKSFFVNNRWQVEALSA